MVNVLTGVIISPQADTAEYLSGKLNELTSLRIIRTFATYPTEVELIRYVQMTGPSVVFLNTEDPRAIGLALAVDQSGVGTQVVAVDRACDPQVLVDIMRAGIREFLPLPLDFSRLMEAMDRVAEVLARKPLAFNATDDVFSFLPAKPGDGTSTVALNVSSAIARKSGARTLIADFDLNLGMVSFLLKITNGRSVLDAISFAENLDLGVWENLVVKRNGLDVLCSGRLDPGITLGASKVGDLLHFARRTYDTICLDLSGNMEPYSIELMRQSKELFVVCTSDIPSLHFARAKVDFLRQSGLDEKASVLLNRSEKRSTFSIQDVEKLLGLRVRFSFANDPKRVSSAMNAGTYVDPKSEIGRQFEAFAECLGAGTKPGAVIETQKKRFIEYFAIVPSTYHADEEKRR